SPCTGQQHSALEDPPATQQHEQEPADSTVNAPPPEFPPDSPPADSSAVGAPWLADELILRSRTGLAALLTDTSALGAVRSRHDLEGSHAFYLDDVFRLRPSYLSGDSLGNGYSRKFNPLGAGFDALAVNLNGMPLDDPLTGMVDWRMLEPDVIGRAFMVDGGALSGPRGGAGEVNLLSRRVDLPTAASRMRIAGGAYDINKIGGSIRRRIFGSAAVHVDINRIQQSTEDFSSEVEEIQYFTRLEKTLGGSALLSLDGLYFSTDRKPGTGSREKYRKSNTHIQLALTGGLGANAGYRLAWHYASSRHPYLTEGGVTNLGARRDGYAGSFVYRPAEKVSLGLDFQGTEVKPEDFVQGSLPSGSSSGFKVLGLMQYDGPVGMRVHAAGGVRSGSRWTKTGAVAALGVSKIIFPALEASLDWKRDLLDVPLATRVSRSGPEAEAYRPGESSSFEAAAGIALPGERKLRLGLLYRRMEGLYAAAYEPDPLRLLDSRWLDYRLKGLFYLYQGALFGPLFLRAEGLELFDTPQDVPYLASRRHSFVLGLEGTFFRQDMGYSIQAEAAYEGRFYYPFTQDPATALRSQPGRMNFGGAAAVRIIDLTIFCRLDFLMSDYYNGVDPLRLPAPRAVFGVNWDFLD
ncbi:MAG: hypothetical protein U9N45_03955, partial [Gemmatimonadota bacterium]|nr:hypothetical protein [Gemmatimonadota bacterium]